MLTPLVRDDVPDGLVFSLGYSLDPGARLFFLRATPTDGTRFAETFATQTRAALGRLTQVLAAADPEAVIVKVRRYLTDSRLHRSPAVQEAWTNLLGETKPASTALQVPANLGQGSLLALEAWGVGPPRPGAAALERSSPAGGIPAVVAVRGDSHLRAGVQMSSAPPGDGVLEHLRSCLDALEDALAAAGSTPGDLVKLTIYHPDVRVWADLEHEVLARFRAHCPVVTAVMVSSLLTPGSRVGLTWWARVPSVAASTLSLTKHTLALTGTAALDLFVGGRAEEMYRRPIAATIEGQALQAMENQGRVLAAAGAGFADVVRSNWYVTDIREWPAIEEVARDCFGSSLPAPMVIEVPRLVAKPGVRVEPDLWATLP